MKVDKKVWILALAIAVVVITSVTAAFALGILPPKQPGIYVTIVPAGLKEGVPKNAYTVAQVSLVTPDCPMKVVYRGKVNGLTLLIPYSKVEGVVEKWVKEGHVMPGIMIDYWIVSEDGKLIASGTTMVNYDPAELMKTKILRTQATITVTKELPEEQPQEGNTSTVKAAPITKKTKPIQPEDLRSFTWYEWRRVFYVTPENYTKNRSKYIKLPIIIIYNSLYTSEENLYIMFKLGVYRKIGFSVVAAVGYNIESKSKAYGASSVIPYLTFKVYGKSILSVNKTALVPETRIPPGKMGYIWIMAEPITEYQKEWKCTAGAMGYVSCQLTGKERVLEYINDFKSDSSGSVYSGAVVNYPQCISWPIPGFSEKLEELMNNIDLKKVVIKGNRYLNDGILNHNEVLDFDYLFDLVQHNCNDEEFTIPVGAAVAAILTTVSGGELAWVVPILTAFSTTMIYSDEGASIITGYIINRGQNPVSIYVGITKTGYEVGFENLKIPVMYFEALPP